MIEVLEAGPFATVQDLGRGSFIGEGIGLSGAMDRFALRRGNRLVGNGDDAAGIETTNAPLKLRIAANLVIAVTGAPGSVLVNKRPIPCDWAEPVKAGDDVLIAPSAIGMWRYVAVCGGLDVPLTLGSRSTDLKNGFGGLDRGRPLRPGDTLATGEILSKAWQSRVLRYAGLGMARIGASASGANVDETIIRVLPAREYSDFTQDSRTDFWTTPWQVGSESNRQGYKLNGAVLKTEEPLSLLSYGLIPGTIQVPQAGQPIVQLAEANTCGGYPKIGVVIEADIGRLAQSRPGQKVQFKRVSRSEALDAMRAEERCLDAIQALPEALVS